MTEQWRHVEVPAARLDGWLDRFAARHGAFDVRAAGDGVELAAADGQRAMLALPFPQRPPHGNPPSDAEPAPSAEPSPDPSPEASPAPPARQADGDPLAALRADVARRRVVGVLLIRRGGYAIGVYDGGRLIASKVGSSYVQGSTKAGGWSQQRYARRRDNQTRAIVHKAADDAVRVLGDRLGPAGELDAALAGGDRALIRAALEDPRLRGFADRLREPFLSVGDPRRATLAELADRIGAVRVSLLP